MTDTIDKVAFAAAELLAASDALASAAAEVDALRAEVARQTGIAVDYCARAGAAEQMVAECCALLADVKNAEWMSRREGLTPSPFWGDEWQSRIDAALSRTEAVAGRWVPAAERDEVMAERDAAIAARDEAVREMHSSDSAARMLGDDFARVLRDCTAAERARDEVGIQIAAAQAEIARMRATLTEIRTCVRHSSTNSLRDDLIVALAVLDIVSGDTLVRP